MEKWLDDEGVALPPLAAVRVEVKKCEAALKRCEKELEAALGRHAAAITRNAPRDELTALEHHSIRSTEKVNAAKAALQVAKQKLLPAPMQLVQQPVLVVPMHAAAPPPAPVQQAEQEQIAELPAENVVPASETDEDSDDEFVEQDLEQIDAAVAFLRAEHGDEGYRVLVGDACDVCKKKRENRAAQDWVSCSTCHARVRCSACARAKKKKCVYCTHCRSCKKQIRGACMVCTLCRRCVCDPSCIPSCDAQHPHRYSCICGGQLLSWEQHMWDDDPDLLLVQ